MTTNPYESADDATLAEIIRHAESLLASQLQAAIAADQRALTFSGLLVAGVAAIIAVAAGPDRPGVPLTIIATLLGLAALSALWSARPTQWCFAGTPPKMWTDDLLDPAKTLHLSKAEMAQHYDGALYRNRRAMNRAGWAMRISLLLTATSLLVLMVWAWVLAV